MEFHNLTPFPALVFEGIDQYDREFHVIVMRATFDIASDLELKPSEEQFPLEVTDQYFGEMNKSSVRQESDLAYYKPKCDIIINATAHAPGGMPVSSFSVGIRITGQTGHDVILEKTLTVTGPRFWKKRGNRWELTKPEPLTSLPLRYEYAYGGECRIEKDDPAAEKLDSKYLLTPEQRAEHPAGPDHAPVAHTACETNPVGMGFAEPWYLDAIRPEIPPPPLKIGQPRSSGFTAVMERLLFMHPLPGATTEAPTPTARSRHIPAPQIESPLEPITEFGRHYAPQGFGVITKAWLPRRNLGGTVDEEFVESEHWLPDDFDFAFWNGAHPEMQVPWLKGGERVELRNLFPPDTTGAMKDQHGNTIVGFAVPEEKPYLFIRLAGQGIVPCDLKIDTVLIDTEGNKAAIVYRTVLWKEPEISAVASKVISKRDRVIIDGWLNRNEAGEEAPHG